MDTILAVHVTPKAAQDGVCGITRTDAGAEVEVRVRAVPDGGKANKATCEVVAAFLCLPKRAVSVASGATSRHKRLKIEGMSADELSQALAVLE